MSRCTAKVWPGVVRSSRPCCTTTNLHRPNNKHQSVRHIRYPSDAALWPSALRPFSEAETTTLKAGILPLPYLHQKRKPQASIEYWVGGHIPTAQLNPNRPTSAACKAGSAGTASVLLPATPICQNRNVICTVAMLLIYYIINQAFLAPLKRHSCENGARIAGDAANW